MSEVILGEAKNLSISPLLLAQSSQLENRQLMNQASPKPVVLAIAGCSGSGKTTLAAELATQLNATLFPLDLYYRDLS